MTIKQKKDHKNKTIEGGSNWKTKKYRVNHALTSEDIKKSGKKNKDFLKKEEDDYEQYR